jgi:tetratricopeptide (TPR) repeat protein
MMIRGQTGDRERALAYGEASLAIARELGLREQMALTLSSLSGAYRNLNRPDRANAAIEESQHLFHEVGNLPMLADSYAAWAFFLSGAGEFDAALSAAKKARRISQSIGNLWNQGSAAFSIALVYRERGDVGDALRELESALMLPGMEHLTFVKIILNYRLMGTYVALGALTRAMECWHVVNSALSGFPAPFRQRFNAKLASLQLAQGDLVAARQSVKAAVVGLNKDTVQNAYGVTAAFLVYVAVELALGNYTETLRVAEKLVGLVKKLNVGTHLPYALFMKGRALFALRNIEEATETLSLARCDAEDRGQRLVLWQILAVLAEVEELEGNTSKAESLHRQAQEIITYIADHSGSEELRASFLALPDVRGVLKRLEL